MSQGSIGINMSAIINGDFKMNCNKYSHQLWVYLTFKQQITTSQQCPKTGLCKIFAKFDVRTELPPITPNRTHVLIVCENKKEWKYEPKFLQASENLHASEKPQKTPKFSRFDAAASFSVMNVWLLRAEKTVNQSGVECDRHFDQMQVDCWQNVCFGLSFAHIIWCKMT